MNIIFIYKGEKAKIQCNPQEKMKDIFKKYESKIGVDITNLFFIYNGNKINEELKFEEIINSSDIKENTINILVFEKNEQIKKENIIKSKEVLCPTCKDNALINIKKYKISFNCKNGHKIKNKILNENMLDLDVSQIVCNICKDNNKGNAFNNIFYRCITCKKNICPLCKAVHDKEHKIINYDNKNCICEKHYMNYIKYCKGCKLNICMKCVKEHIDHDIIDFGFILVNEEDIVKDKNKLEKCINKLNEEINHLIDKLNKLKEYFKIYYNTYNNITINYNIQTINYEILQNINEFKNYNSNIIKDLNNKFNINDDNNINSKFMNIIDLYNQIYEYGNNMKMDNLFEKEPQNLKYKLDITTTNDNWGMNDIFEVFKSYEDNKEYIISPNYENHNLDIFLLLDNKKMMSLSGHKDSVAVVRYFFNNKDINEYLISADSNNLVIIWDITDNYNIKHKFNAYSNGEIYSCLLIFPNNIDDNYIITSTSLISKNNDDSATKIFSLENGNFIKYFENTSNKRIYYLLSWHNKINNKYYIIQISYGKIIINNLLEDELYSELIHQPEDNYNSGFIFSKEKDDYLCSTSENGNINIWDLYKKNILKTINIKNSYLYHIIKWNNKFIIVADYKNGSLKIVNIENENISDINEKNNGALICIKKIFHPKYGESLLTAGENKTIRLWSV